MKKLTVLVVLLVAVLALVGCSGDDGDIIGDIVNHDLTISVTDGSNAVEDATVVINETEKETDENGVVQFELEEGDYTAEVTADKYQEESKEVALDEEDSNVEITLDDRSDDGEDGEDDVEFSDLETAIDEAVTLKEDTGVGEEEGVVPVETSQEYSDEIGLAMEVEKEASQEKIAEALNNLDEATAEFEEMKDKDTSTDDGDDDEEDDSLEEEPIGFVAEGTDRPGEVFLSMGPTEMEGIVHKIYYAPASEEIKDPKSEAENISVDGQLSASVEDLEPGKDYKFWLYHHDPETDEFSEPAEVTATAGGEEGEEIPPHDPAGLIADVEIDGEQVGSGEVFLAVGENQVGEEEIEYKLYYAPTSEEISDPKDDAKEYEFGSTEEDKGGDEAFGFKLGGLEEGTEYKFWLYQYDKSVELHSESAATATITAGE
ncbi:MAG: hypothetical protein ACQEP9_02695 [Bacillota bacterium]